MRWELVMHNRLGKNSSKRFISRYYDAVTVGIDFTARDLQSMVLEEGKSWSCVKGLMEAIHTGDFVSVDRFKDIQNLNFHLDIDGKTVQRGNTADMLFKVDEIIAYVSRFFTLKIGDLFYRGSCGEGQFGIGQHLQGYLEGEKLLDFYVR